MPTIHERHIPLPEDKNKPFAELAYFLHSLIDQTEDITPLTIVDWLNTHQEYSRTRHRELCYLVYKDKD